MHLINDNHEAVASEEASCDAFSRLVETTVVTRPSKTHPAWLPDSCPGHSGPALDGCSSNCPGTSSASQAVPLPGTPLPKICPPPPPSPSCFCLYVAFLLETCLIRSILIMLRLPAPCTTFCSPYVVLLSQRFLSSKILCNLHLYAFLLPLPPHNPTGVSAVRTGTFVCFVSRFIQVSRGLPGSW